MDTMAAGNTDPSCRSCHRNRKPRRSAFHFSFRRQARRWCVTGQTSLQGPIPLLSRSSGASGFLSHVSSAFPPGSAGRALETAPSGTYDMGARYRNAPMDFRHPGPPSMMLGGGIRSLPPLPRLQARGIIPVPPCKPLPPRPRRRAYVYPAAHHRGCAARPGFNRFDYERRSELCGLLRRVPSPEIVNIVPFFTNAGENNSYRSDRLTNLKRCRRASNLVPSPVDDFRLPIESPRQSWEYLVLTRWL